jgi:hypothetical protein
MILTPSSSISISGLARGGSDGFREEDLAGMAEFTTRDATLTALPR